MIENKKAAKCGDTEAAQQKYSDLHFKPLAMALKAACFLLATWLSIVGGVGL